MALIRLNNVLNSANLIPFGLWNCKIVNNLLKLTLVITLINPKLIARL